MYNEKLLTFIAVAECGSLNKAAEKLFISPVSVMNQINSLESHFKVKLINRSTSGIQLTEEGQVILKEARNIIKKSDEILKSLQNKSSKHKIRIGLFKMDYFSEFAMNLRIFNNSNSMFNVEIEMISDDIYNAQILENMLKNEFDCIYMIESNKYVGNYNFKSIGNTKIAFGIPVDSPLATKKSIKECDLKNHTIILFTSSQQNQLDYYCKKLIENCNMKTIRYPGLDGIELLSYCVKSEYLLCFPERYTLNFPFMKVINFSPSTKITRGLYYTPSKSNLLDDFIFEFSKTKSKSI